MPTKASITTRTAKGSPLTTAEMDANLTNLRDQSIGIADDGSTVLSVDSGNTITIAGSGTVSTALSGTTLTVTGSGITASSTDTLTNKTISSASNTITITESNISDLGSYITASSTDTLTNKTIDANGTGNAISNLEVADFAGSAIVTEGEGLASSDNDTSIPTTAAVRDYVDAVAQGLHIHASTAAATTGTLTSITGDTVTYDNGTSGVGATLTLSTALTTLDGYSLQNGDRILVKNESTQAHNGVYTWATGGTVLTRATDFDQSAEMQSGDFIFVSNGSTYGDTGWVQTEVVTTVGTDNIIWTQFSGAGTFTAGDGLTLTGTDFSVNVDSSTIEINADTLRVKDAGITNAKLATSTITLVGDDSTGTVVSLGETFKIAGAQNITTAVSGDILTVTGPDLTSYITASSTDTLTNKTIDANGTGNSITNLEVADLAAGVLDTDLSSVSASDDTLASAKAIKTYADTKIANVVEDTTPQLGGSLDVNSQKIVSLSNGTIELEPNGTGNVLADVTGGGSLKIENTHTFTSGLDDIYPGRALTLSDSGGATITIDQYLQESPAANSQFFSIYFDNTGTYTYPSGATAGDVSTYIGYNFDDETCDWTAQGGDLFISALNHTDYSDANIILNTPLKSYKELVHTLTSSTTITVDCSLAQVSRVALGTNTQIHFTNLPAGKSHTIVIVSSGSYTASFSDDTSTAVKFPGGAPTITASGTDVVTVFNTGSEILGNIAQDFS